MTSASHRRVTIATLFIMCLLVGGAGVAHVAQRQEAIRLGYELTDATEKLELELNQSSQLGIELSVLKDPKSIETQARALGMVHPNKGQILNPRPQPRTPSRHALRRTRPVPGQK